MTPLRQRMLEDMGIRNFAENTQLSYLQQVSLYARHFHRSPEELGPEQVRAYQVHLTTTRKLAPGSASIATAALRFLYKVTLKRDWAPDDIPRPKKAFKLPVVLSPEEVSHFLGCVDSLKQRTILTTAYAAGLRVSEATHLKVTDVDSQRMVLRIHQGKGRRDRYVMLSPRLLEALRSYWKVVRPETWLFPGDIPGQPITPSAVELACRKAHRTAGITKPITPHSLRHYLPFLTMSGSSPTAACFQEIREAGVDIVLAPPSSPQAGMRPPRTVELRSRTSDHSMRHLRYFARHLRSGRGDSAVLSQLIASPLRGAGSPQQSVHRENYVG